MALPRVVLPWLLIAAIGTPACTVSSGIGPKGPQASISGPGPEIAIGAGLVIGGGYLMYRSANMEQDSYGLQSTFEVVSAAIAVFGALVIARAVYHLATTADPPPGPPPGPPPLGSPPAPSP
jgi:hypothetical protein